MKNRTPTKDLKEQVGGEVTVAGFVDVRRDHGKLIFIDLRDESGKVQIIALPGRKEAHELAGAIRPEWVISVTGKGNKRPEKLINKKRNPENRSARRWPRHRRGKPPQISVLGPAPPAHATEPATAP